MLFFFKEQWVKWLGFAYSCGTNVSAQYSCLQAQNVNNSVASDTMHQRHGSWSSSSWSTNWNLCHHYSYFLLLLALLTMLCVYLLSTLPSATHSSHFCVAVIHQLPFSLMLFFSTLSPLSIHSLTLHLTLSAFLVSVLFPCLIEAVAETTLCWITGVFETCLNTTALYVHSHGGTETKFGHTPRGSLHISLFLCRYCIILHKLTECWQWISYYEKTSFNGFNMKLLNFVCHMKVYTVCTIIRQVRRIIRRIICINEQLQRSWSMQNVNKLQTWRKEKWGPLCLKPYPKQWGVCVCMTRKVWAR